MADPASGSEVDEPMSEHHAQARTRRRRGWSFVYGEMKAFFGSGFSYILVGSAFLLAAYLLIEDNSHPSFVFLLAILGVAIVLYGTGTEAAGTGKTGRLNIAIAGGAGVLAALFGFGIVQYSEKIAGVFAQTRSGALLMLKTESQVVDLEKCQVSAEESIESRPLHLWKRRQTAEVYMPVYSMKARGKATVTIECPDPAGKGLMESFRQEYDIDWGELSFIVRTSDGVPERKSKNVEKRGGGADFTYLINDRFLLTSASSTIQVAPDGGERVGEVSLTVEPQ